MSVLSRIRPVSLQGYKPSWLSRDVVAGVTLAAIAIPECMGYTSISQTPVVTGLYSVIFPTMGFALLGSSRLLVVGADSATAAILAAGLPAAALPAQVVDVVDVADEVGLLEARPCAGTRSTSLHGS